MRHGFGQQLGTLFASFDQARHPRSDAERALAPVPSSERKLLVGQPLRLGHVTARQVGDCGKPTPRDQGWAELAELRQPAAALEQIDQRLVESTLGQTEVPTGGEQEVERVDTGDRVRGCGKGAMLEEGIGGGDVAALDADVDEPPGVRSDAYDPALLGADGMA